MAATPEAGDRFDQAQWGALRYWTGTEPLTIQASPAVIQDGLIHPAHTPEYGGWTFGVEWENPRIFDTVVVEYDDHPPNPAEVKLQYWNHTWPAEDRGGWTATDDPYNGRWITAHDNVDEQGTVCTHTFDPLDINEIERALDCAVLHRCALKLRLLYKGPTAPRVKSLRVYGSHSLAEAGILITTGIDAPRPARLTGQVSIQNGFVIEKDDSASSSVVLRVLYADCTGPSPDAAIVTLHCEGRGFSFLVSDAVDSGVYIPDLGVYITSAENPTSLDDYLAACAGIRTFYDRVTQEPEQSYRRAANEIPQLVPSKQDRYVILGCDSNRQEFALRWNGDIYADKLAMKMKKRDTARLLWPGHKLEFRFPTGDPIDTREREGFNSQSCLDGYLPIYITQWLDREIEFTQTAFAAYMHETPFDEPSKRGDEPIAALARFDIRNTTAEDRTAVLWIITGGEPEALSVEDGLIFAVGRIAADDVPSAEDSIERRWVKRDYDHALLRAAIETFGAGEAVAAACSLPPHLISGLPNAVRYTVDLKPRESHSIVLKIPFVTFRRDHEAIARLRHICFEQRLEEMRGYWRSRIDEAAVIEIPDTDLTDFNRAVYPHILITGDKDVDTGHYMLGAGTWVYDVFGTETIDQVRAIDLQGHHEQARRYLQPWLDLQGSRRMDGRFRTQEGALHGLRVDDEYDYQMGDYSHDHGTVLWWLAEHYMLTRDREWLESVADKLIKACDYITSERSASMITDPNGNPVWEYGLLPECHLDDNPEWLHWYVINALCRRAMIRTAECLEEIDHPDAPRIREDAEAFHRDIRRAVDLSIERAPVVRLWDGTWVPFVPVRCGLRGRDVGWIREALYGPIQLIDCGIIDPNSLEATWILRDCEDNVFLSRATGRQVDTHRFWFSQGGITIQSNLLPNTLVYLRREQPAHAIRAFYNSFAANFYRDVRCFCEHPIHCYGVGVGPFYKTPDEAAFLTWLRYLLLREDSSTLVIAPGTPRAWLRPGKQIICRQMATYFGPVGFTIRSHEEASRISASINPPARSAPDVIDLRLRHPDGLPIRRVTVNGTEHEDFGSESVRLTDLSGSIEVIAYY